VATLSTVRINENIINEGVPTGGGANTSLTKVSAADFDTEWRGHLGLTGGTITGDLYVIGNITKTEVYHAYGGFQDVSETIVLDADTWTHITNATNDLWVLNEGDGISIVADDIIIANTGDYMGNVSLTLTGGNSKDFLFRLYNVTQNHAHYYIGVSTTVSNYSNVALPIYIEATAGDHYQIQVKCVAGDDPTIRSAIFNISYLHS